ncbi:MAG TPA: MgtC/SapB family protein [Candidatus Eisenbacteria bacterium]|jgi:putative Mg2+ transporter-C (MgtC) family protein|nr:MgtC/SapB family protein [Candidatus Eisenbacteria bacterium]
MIPVLTISYRLLWAALLGAVIGVERNIRKRPAGMRTGVCVCVGAALFTIVSSEFAKLTGDASTTRIASNIVQGIGFLGAGVILRNRGSVMGVTTAAAIFAEAAIGMAAGAGFYRVSLVAAILLLFSLSGLIYVESLFNLKSRYVLFRITTDAALDLVTEVHRIFDEQSIKLENFLVFVSGEKHVIQFDADIRHQQQSKILASLVRPGVSVELLPVERQLE